MKCLRNYYILSSYSHQKIYTDLDIFYSFYKNKSITVTGTNGKSTTAQILYEVLEDQKYDVRLIGNIGNPALSEKKITKHTIFVIEASSYQLEYSQIFSSKYAAILNIAPDHIERHKNLKNYITAKFKLLVSQPNNATAFINKNDPLITKKIDNNNLKQKIIKIDSKKSNKIYNQIKNEYFLSSGNKENLSFVLKILKIFKLNNKILLKTLNKFKGLKYRQQIIFKNKNLTIINDSKSTSFASSENLGHETIQEIGVKKIIFSDKKVILNAIKIKNLSLSNNLKFNILKELSEEKKLSSRITLKKAQINSKEIKKGDIFFAIKEEVNENLPSRSAKLRYGIKKSNFYDFETDILDQFKNLIEIENFGDKL